MRILGGRSLSWGRQSYRMGDIDFKCADRDGFGENWPISYKDLVPYYETVEKFIGISGREEGLAQLPDSVFLPPMGMTCGETIFRDRVKQKIGRVVTIGRAADPDQGPQRPRRLPLLRAVRAGLHYALLLSQPLGHAGRRRKDRPLHGRHRRRRQPRGARRAKRVWLPGVAYIDRVTRRAARTARQGRRAVRLDARIDAHPAQFRAGRAWPTPAGCSGTT